MKRLPARPGHPTSSPMRLRPVLLALSLVFPACAGWQVTRTAADVLLPPQDEAQIGRQLEADLRKKEKPLDDEEVQTYVRDLGVRLAGLTTQRWPTGIVPRVSVLDSDTVNAFAMPGGAIFVYRGLLVAADSEAELAGVIAHELGHVVQRHVAQQLVTKFGLEALTSLALGSNPSLFAQLGANIAQTGYLLSYSRDDEREADRVGMATILRSRDWAPQGMIRFFDTLAKQGDGGPSFLSTHPPPRDRAAALAKQVAAAGNPSGNEYRERYQAIRARFARGK